MAALQTSVASCGCKAQLIKLVQGPQHDVALKNGEVLAGVNPLRCHLHKPCKGPLNKPKLLATREGTKMNKKAGNFRNPDKEYQR